MSINRTATTKTLARDSIITIAEGQVSSELAGEIIILDLKAGIYYGLSQVGTSVWKLIQQPMTVRDITKAIIAEYAVDLTQCENDVDSLLKDLAAKGLINVRSQV